MNHQRLLGVTLAVIGLVATVGCTSNKNLSSASAVTTTSVAATAAPTTTAAATTTTTTTVAPTTTATPTTVPATSDGLSKDTVLKATPSGGIQLDADFNCGFDPGIPGWTVADCQHQSSFSNGVLTLVLRWKGGDGHFAVAVMFKSGTHLVQRYWAEEPAAHTWTSVKVVLGDFHHDDGAEVWVGYRYDGSGQYLDLDVLDPLPDGTFFLRGIHGVSKGVIDVHPGGATVQEAVFAASDPKCCPSKFTVKEIFFHPTQMWRITNAVTYPAAGVPPLTGDF